MNCLDQCSTYGHIYHCDLQKKEAILILISLKRDFSPKPDTKHGDRCKLGPACSPLAPFDTPAWMLNEGIAYT